MRRQRYYATWAFGSATCSAVQAPFSLEHGQARSPFCYKAALWAALRGDSMARVEVASEVTGNVWKVEVAAGAKVAAGDVLMILESMKMEIPVEAPAAGTVAEVRVAVEASVAEDQVLLVLET